MIGSVLKDGVIDDQEHEQLLRFFDFFVTFSMAKRVRQSCRQFCNDMNKTTRLTALLIASILLSTLILGCGKGGNSSSTHSDSVSESDVTGRWIGYYNGLIGADITLFYGGTGTYSSDYGSQKSSSCRWSLKERDVVIDLGDTGSKLHFRYKNSNTLVADNGLTLDRKQ